MDAIALQVEALLFALGRAVSRKELQKMLTIDAATLDVALQTLAQNEHGVVVVDDGNEIELRAAGSAHALIERVRQEEYKRDIGKAGLEVLSCVLYRGPLTRSEIDFIRGVNSSQTIRTLTLRGLIRRTPNPRDERSYLYEPTTELLGDLGVARAKDLPDFAQVRDKLQKLENAYREKQQHEP